MTLMLLSIDKMIKAKQHTGHAVSWRIEDRFASYGVSPRRHLPRHPKSHTGSISQQVFVGRRTRQQHPVGNRKILRFPKSHLITRCGT